MDAKNYIVIRDGDLSVIMRLRAGCPQPKNNKIILEPKALSIKSLYDYSNPMIIDPEGVSIEELDSLEWEPMVLSGKGKETEEASSTTAPRQCCGNCACSDSVFQWPGEPSFERQKVIFCKKKGVSVPHLCPSNCCWEKAEQKEAEPKQETEAAKGIKELSLTEFVRGCLLNHQLRAATKWGEEWDEGHGYDPEEDQDEICADLAEQNQQLQRRVDELEKCLAVQEEQISDCRTVRDVLQSDNASMQLALREYVKLNGQFRLLNSDIDEIHPDDEFFDYQADAWITYRDLKNDYNRYQRFVLQGRTLILRRKIKFTTRL